MVEFTHTAQLRGARTTVELVVHQFQYDLRAFFRNRQSRFFTLALPVLFLVIFASVFGGKHDTVAVSGGRLDTSVYYVPGIITLGIVAAAFVNLVISVTAQREAGVLKRRRAAPIPASAIIAGRAMTAVIVAVAITAVLLAIGWVRYHAHVPARTVPALAATVVLGATAFCCLGYALAAMIRNEDAAQPITQAIVMPLYFISGVYVPISRMPHWLVDVANVFPIRHLAAAMLAAYDPHTSGSGFAGRDLLIVAGWGLAGLVFALRKFSWLPLSR